MLNDNVREHLVIYGDTLASLSQKYYGKPDFALVIYKHNEHYIQNPNMLYPGQKLVIPHIGTAVKVG